MSVLQPRQPTRASLPHRSTVQVEVFPRLAWEEGTEGLLSCAWTEFQIRKVRRRQKSKAVFKNFLYRKSDILRPFKESSQTLLQAGSISFLTRLNFTGVYVIPELSHSLPKMPFPILPFLTVKWSPGNCTVPKSGFTISPAAQVKGLEQIWGVKY